MKSKKIRDDVLLDQVSEVLEELVGLTLNDVIRQACALSEEDREKIDYENFLKMTAYLKSNKRNVH
jgi:hypothetical protein